MARMVGGVGAFLMLLLSAATVAASHEPTHFERCSDARAVPTTFVCGEVSVHLIPGETDITPVLNACQTAPLDVTRADRADPATGALGFVAKVPTGSEVDLRNCYASQPTVYAAVLGGFGELTDTALPGPQLASIATRSGTTLLVLALLLTVTRLGRAEKSP